MAEQPAKPKSRKHSERWNHYDASSGNLTRKKKFCPKCGPGYFMAEHKNRITCGKCSYVEFKGKEPTEVKEKAEEEKKQENSENLQDSEKHSQEEEPKAEEVKEDKESKEEKPAEKE